MSFRYIRKQSAEYRTQETCQSINPVSYTHLDVYKRQELITYKAELAGDKNVTQYELLLGDIDKREVKKAVSYTHLTENSQKFNVAWIPIGWCYLCETRSTISTVSL